MDRWVGKVAVVTGANGGIGEGLVRALNDARLKVVGLDIEVPQGKKVSENVVWRKCNITNLEELKTVFKWIEETFGGVDVMVNCAGVAQNGQITCVGPNPISDEDVSKIIDVNLKAMIYCSRLAVQSMKKRDFDGHIVNICSIAGHYIPFLDSFNVYSCSKYAVKAFTESLANEFGSYHSKIRTTNISPGFVKTPMTEEFMGSRVDTFPSLQPRDIADAVIYAISTPPHVNITQMTVQSVTEKRL